MIAYHRCWETLKKRALKRDNYTCQECGSTECLEVHHIKTRKNYPELAHNLDNLKTLCRTCHLKAHGKTGNKKKKTLSLALDVVIFIREQAKKLDITESQLVEMIVREYIEGRIEL